MCLSVISAPPARFGSRGGEDGALAPRSTPGAIGLAGDGIVDDYVPAGSESTLRFWVVTLLQIGGCNRKCIDISFGLSCASAADLQWLIATWI